MDIEKISNLIKTKRKEKCLTQEELANKINVTEKAISRWETGRGTPDISLLVPLSKELDISVSEILKGKEDKKEEKNIHDIVDYINKSKSKKNKYVIPIAATIYVILLLLYLWYLRVDYNINGTHIAHFGELVYNTFFISVIYFTNRFIANNYYDTLEERNKMNKVSYIMILVVYLIMLFNMTIFSRSFYGNTFNLIPFKTISYYFKYPDDYNIVINVIGNIIIMMPIQFLIIKIFDFKEFNKCFLVDIVLVLLVEILQLISHTGIFDVDDIILNLIGMVIMYFLTIGKHKIIHQFKSFIITSYFSMIIVQFMFYNISWYCLYCGTPTTIVLRLIISFIIIEGIIYLVYKLIKKKRTSQD